MKTKYILIIIITCVLWGCKGTKNVVDKKTIAAQNETKTTPSKQRDNLSERNDTSIFKGKESLTIVGPDSIYYSITKPDTIPPILLKIFPDVEFYYSQTISVTNSSQRMMCYFQGQKYNPIMSFNFLVSRMKYIQV